MHADSDKNLTRRSLDTTRGPSDSGGVDGHAIASPQWLSTASLCSKDSSSFASSGTFCRSTACFDVPFILG